MGIKDIGFGITVSNHNSNDMLSLYQLSKSLGMEFATAAFHNSYYFHKEDNYITNKEEVCNNFTTLMEWQLKEKHPTLPRSSSFFSDNPSMLMRIPILGKRFAIFIIRSSNQPEVEITTLGDLRKHTSMISSRSSLTKGSPPVIFINFTEGSFSISAIVISFSF